MCDDLDKMSKMVKSLPLRTLHEMILSHSQFLRIMLGDAEAQNPEKAGKDSEVKGEVTARFTDD